MDESAAVSFEPWRAGIHPHAAGMRVRSLGRVELPLGEALRLEMAGAELGGDSESHVQYYIETEAGAWAIWISCARDDLPRHETTLQTIAMPVES